MRQKGHYYFVYDESAEIAVLQTTRLLERINNDVLMCMSVYVYIYMRALVRVCARESHKESRLFNLWDIFKTFFIIRPIALLVFFIFIAIDLSSYIIWTTRCGSVCVCVWEEEDTSSIV